MFLILFEIFRINELLHKKFTAENAENAEGRCFFSVYSVVFEPFQKIIKSLFFYKLLKLEIAPLSYGKPLRHPLAGTWEIYFEKR